jgi:hypothetical protein
MKLTIEEIKALKKAKDKKVKQDVIIYKNDRLQ